MVLYELPTGWYCAAPKVGVAPDAGRLAEPKVSEYEKNNHYRSNQPNDVVHLQPLQNRDAAVVKRACTLQRTSIRLKQQIPSTSSRSRKALEAKAKRIGSGGADSDKFLGGTKAASGCEVVDTLP